MNYIRTAAVILMNIALFTNPAKAQYKEFQKLMDENRMFELRDRFNDNKENLSDWEKLYFEANLDNAFGKLEESDKAIEILLEKYPKQLRKSHIISLLSLSADNNIKLFKYKEAAEVYARIKNDYGNGLTAEEKKELQNGYELCKSIENVPAQKTHHATATEVSIIRNQFNHWTIPVRNDAQSEDTIKFVFDSGANFSTIRRGIAERMGTVLTGNFIEVGSSLGNKVQAEMGYIPKLFIGDLELDNVVVLVFPDEMLTFESVGYHIYGIIGFPEIRSFGEFSISKDERLVIASEKTQNAPVNLFMSGMTPHVQTLIDGQTYTMIFDTGAVSSHLGQRFYKKNRSQVKANSMAQNTNIGGVGGSKKIKNRMWKNFSMTIAGRNVNLVQIDIMLKTPTIFKNSDGFLGQDVLLAPNEVVMNLRDMYLFFRD